MPEHPNHTRTEPKRVYLTPEARLGLQQDPRDAWGPALAAKVVGAIRADLGRYRALLAATALDAGTTLRVASAATKTLRPKEYPDIKRLARLEAVA